VFADAQSRAGGAAHGGGPRTRPIVLFRPPDFFFPTRVLPRRGHQVFSEGDLRERVYQKHAGDPAVFVCYCFGYTLAELAELARGGPHSSSNNPGRHTCRPNAPVTSQSARPLLPWQVRSLIDSSTVIRGQQDDGRWIEMRFGSSRHRIDCASGPAARAPAIAALPWGVRPWTFSLWRLKRHHPARIPRPGGPSRHFSPGCGLRRLAVPAPPAARRRSSLD